MSIVEGQPPAAEAGRRAFEIVLAWVDEAILEGRLRVGDLLPAERELARRLDVSRSAVREAVRTLQAQGVVRSTVGAGSAGGTTITGVPAHALTRLLRLHVALANFRLPDVIEVRVSLERLSARLAATHWSESDLVRLREALDAMEQAAGDRDRFNDADTAFHVALARAAGNLLAADLTVAIRESLRLPILDQFRHLPAWDELARRLLKEHAAILDAIEARDAAAAESLVEEHIRSAWRTLTTGSGVRTAAGVDEVSSARPRAESGA